MTNTVIFVDETALLGGAEINLLMVIPHLSQRGWQPSVVLPGPGPLVRRLEEADIPYNFVPRPPLFSTTYQWRHRVNIPNPFALILSLLSGLIWSFRLYRCFRRERPDVVHTISMWTHDAA